MQSPGLIDEYVGRLARKLDFDRALRWRVCREVEDHLREAAATNGTGDVAAAERRAVANFGDPDAVAAQFAVISLAKRSRTTSSASIVGIAAVFVAMKGRVAWYAMATETAGGDVKSVAGIFGSIDRYTFWFSVVAGIGCWFYMSSRPFPSTFDSIFRKQIDRVLFASVIMIAALTTSVFSDGVLTAIKLSDTAFSSRSLIPIFSMTVEVASVGFLAFHIRETARRAAQIAAMWNA
jgi:hypothetical protein